MIIEAHLQCAALEMPLSSDDARWFGPLTKTICENNLVRDQEGWYVGMISISEPGKIQPLFRFHTHPKHLPHPAGALSIRGADEEKYAVIDISSPEFGVKGRILEETEVSRALFELYEGGIVSQGFSNVVLLSYCALVIVPPPGQNLPGKSHHPKSYTVTLYLVYRGLQVKEVNHDSKQAKLVRTDVGWITTPRYFQPHSSVRVE